MGSYEMKAEEKLKVDEDFRIYVTTTQSAFFDYDQFIQKD